MRQNEVGSWLPRPRFKREKPMQGRSKTGKGVG
jgi:hypothetical protein